MSPDRQPPHNLPELIDRLLDGRLTDEELTALEELLRQDPVARDSVLDYCQFHSILLFEAHAERAVDRLKLVRSSATVPVSKVTTQAWFSRRFPLTRRNVALFSAAAVLFVAAVLPWMLRPKAVRFATTSPTISRPQITSLKIESGSAQMELANVGSVVLQGPADFELMGPKRARLRYGRIKVVVSKPGDRGFVIEMPNGEVTDLGTEFGIDVAKEGPNGLVVFHGAVDLRVPNSPLNTSQVHVERLVQGDGVTINPAGHMDRIMAIFTGREATFGQVAEGSSGTPAPLIVDVKDNLRTAETKKFYEIVTQGLGEDSRAYVDRPEHEWNGFDERGMPAYLIGADYVKPFNNDKMRTDFQLQVKLSRPAKLFVFFDNRIRPVPKWLSSAFQDTGDIIGIDVGPIYNAQGKAISRTPRGTGPGNEVDNEFSIWEQVVPKAGTVILGPNSGENSYTGMYGIAAVPLKPLKKQRDTINRSAALITSPRSLALSNSAWDGFELVQ